MTATQVALAEDTKVDWAAITASAEFRELFGDHLGDAFVAVPSGLSSSVARLVREVIQVADKTRFEGEGYQHRTEMIALWSRLSAAIQLCEDEEREKGLDAEDIREALFGLRCREAAVLARLAWLQEAVHLYERALEGTALLQEEAKEAHRSGTFLATLVEIACYGCGIGQMAREPWALQQAIGICEYVEKQVEEWGVEVWPALVFYRRQARGVALAVLGKADEGLLKEAIQELEWATAEAPGGASTKEAWPRTKTLVNAYIDLAHVAVSGRAERLGKAREHLEKLAERQDRADWSQRHWLEWRGLFGQVLWMVGFGLRDLGLMESAGNFLSEIETDEVLKAHPDLWLQAKCRRGIVLEHLGEKRKDGRLLREAHAAYTSVCAEGKKQERQWVNAAVAEELRDRLDPTKFDKPAGNVLCTKGDKEEERQISQEPAAATEAIDAGKDFGAAVARAENAVADVATMLQADLDQAFRFFPREARDQKDLIAKVERALKLGVTIEVDGRPASELKVQDEINLVWRVPSRGRAFRRHRAKVLQARKPSETISPPRLEQ